MEQIIGAPRPFRHFWMTTSVAHSKTILTHPKITTPASSLHTYRLPREVGDSDEDVDPRSSLHTSQFLGRHSRKQLLQLGWWNFGHRTSDAFEPVCFERDHDAVLVAQDTIILDHREVLGSDVAEGCDAECSRLTLEPTQFSKVLPDEV